MAPFGYTAAPSVEAAIARAAGANGAEFIAGGTDMLQLLQERVRAPGELIDINGLELSGIAVGPEGARIGALTRMAELADDLRIRRDFPVVAEALLAGASPQVRNMATIGGNLLQRTRCLYFRDTAAPCNRREPDTGCSAQDGASRFDAVLGGSRSCIATYPGDLAVALVALDATVEVVGTRGRRTLPIEALHRLPGDEPYRETVLEPGDLIVAVRIPASRVAARSHYLKVRDRASFEFALASAAVALEIEDGTIRAARVAVGGVATKPWRLLDVEGALVGQPPEDAPFRAAAQLARIDAQPRPSAAFKIELMVRTIARALRTVAAPA